MTFLFRIAQQFNVWSTSLEKFAALVQIIQNSAHLIIRTKKHEKITPVLSILYWLPIQHHTEF